MNHKLPDVQAGFRKGRGTRKQIANIHWIIERAREFQKNIHFCFIDHAKAFDCVDHNTLWKILKEMGIPEHVTYLLRNLYAGQEATVRIGHETTDWFQTGKGVHQGYILSPCLFNLNTDYIMQNAMLDEAQAGIKIAGFSSVQSLSRVRLFATPWSHARSPYHQLLEPTQTHVYHVSDAIQPSHPLAFHYPPAFNLSQHQGLFQ